MVKKWVKDLVVNKTFIGMKYQQAILFHVANKLKTEFRLSNPSEESQGIDGYIGDKGVSIKPVSYSMMNRLPEQIQLPIIYYTKMTDGIKVAYSALK
jgi:hypothetical protein